MADESQAEEAVQAGLGVLVFFFRGHFGDWLRFRPFAEA